MNAMTLLMANLTAMCQDGNSKPVQVDDNTVKIVISDDDEMVECSIDVKNPTGIS